MVEVTIGIALYNLENYIEAALLSALNQDFDNLEILVCDDCSTDKSLDIVNNIINSHPKGDKVRILSSGTNSGTAVVRNLAIDNARGKYIMFLDGDDILPSNIVSEFHKKIEETCADIVTGNIMWFEDCQETNYEMFQGGQSFYKPGLIKGEFAIAEWLKQNKTEFFLAGLWNKLMRTGFLRENSIRCKPSHGVVEDQYFSFLLQFYVKSIYTVDMVSCYYRQRDNSIVHDNISKQRMDLYLKVFDDIVNGFKNKKLMHPNTSFPPQLYYVLTSRYFYGFVTINILQSKQLRVTEKKEYLKRISTIHELGLKKKDLISRANKIVYQTLIRHPESYWRMKATMTIIRIIHFVRNLKNSFSFLRQHLKS